MSKEQEKDVKPDSEQPGTPKFTKKVQGKKALDHLYEKLDDEGLLDDPEQESLVKKLLDRIVVLEHEVSTLKDLISGSIQLNSNKKVEVLKD